MTPPWANYECPSCGHVEIQRKGLKEIGHRCPAKKRQWVDWREQQR